MERDNSVRKFIVTSLFATVAYPPWYFLYKALQPNAYDSLVQRILAPGFFLWLALTFRKSMTARQAQLGMFFGCMACMAQYMFLIIKNDFNMLFMFGGVILMGMVGFTLQSMRQMIIFYASVILLSAFGNWASESFLYHLVWLGSVLSIGLLSTYNFFERDMLLKKIKDDMKVIRDQQITISTTSKLSTLGEMAGGIAHEINNPIAIISGNAQMMKSLAEDKSKPLNHDLFFRMATRIDSTAFRISKIVKGLRSFAREADQDEFTRESVKQIIEETLSFCQAKMNYHGVDVRLEIEDENLYIDCRAVQIQQILLNLFQNAHDAIENLPEKWVEIKVTSVGAFVEIAVTDSGRGISKEIRDKIMEPFFTTKEPGKGTGLGLSITQGIVESHHGKFILDSKSKHTKFILRLPKTQNSIQQKTPLKRAA